MSYNERALGCLSELGKRPMARSSSVCSEWPGPPKEDVRVFLDEPRCRLRVYGYRANKQTHTYMHILGEVWSTASALQYIHLSPSRLSSPPVYGFVCIRLYTHQESDNAEMATRRIMCLRHPLST